MNARSLPLLIFPILGMLLAWIFRPSEIHVQTLHPPPATSVVKRTLHLPDGQGLRFIEVPESGFALSEIEVPASILALYPGETASHAGALAFTEWLSQITGTPLRLPRAGEWRLAAHAGIPNSEFAWGFGPPIPPKGLHFALEEAPQKPGPAFGYGFRDLAGGLWEWSAEGLLLGSAWSEQDPQTLYIDHHWQPPPGYAGADTGFRLLWEEK
jgi:hypothetical protein